MVKARLSKLRKYAPPVTKRSRENRKLRKAYMLVATAMEKPHLLSDLTLAAWEVIVKPSPKWNRVDDDEITIVLQENEERTEGYCREIKAGLATMIEAGFGGEASLVMIASCDMHSEQRDFFLGQYCGEMVIESGCGFDLKGATKLGRILGAEPKLLKIHECRPLVDRVAEISFDDDMKFCDRFHGDGLDDMSDELITRCSRWWHDEAPLHPSASVPIALLIGWTESPMGQPSRWSLKPWPPGSGRGYQWYSCEFESALRMITRVFPTMQEWEAREEGVGGVTIHGNPLSLTRCSAAQLHALEQLLFKASKALEGHVLRRSNFYHRAALRHVDTEAHHRLADIIEADKQAHMGALAAIFELRQCILDEQLGYKTQHSNLNDLSLAIGLYGSDEPSA